MAQHQSRPWWTTRLAPFLAVATFFVILVTITLSYQQSYWPSLVWTKGDFGPALCSPPSDRSTCGKYDKQNVTASPALVDQSSTIYLKPVAPKRPSQIINTEDRSLYADVLVGLDGIEREARNDTDLSHLTYAIIMPTYRGHFPEALRFLTSFKCLVHDYQLVDLHVILSNSIEVEEFEKVFVQEMQKDCPTRFGPFAIHPADRKRVAPKVNFVNFYDIMPPSLKAMASKEDTSKVLQTFDKFNYQGMKKLCAARHFDYDWALWLDSEAIVVQPFSVRSMFDEFVKEPVYFRSRIGRHGPEQDIMRNAAKTLGRDLDSFGTTIFAVESPEWIFEKAVINDLFEWVQDAHGKDFFDAWLNTGGHSFEICVLILHIFARKLETTSSLFSRYKVLEIEREVIRFGGAAGLTHVAHLSWSGFFERLFLALKEPTVQPALSKLLNRWHVRLQRMDGLDFADPEVIKRFLLESPVYMLVCGAPDLHNWWAEKDA